MSIIDQISDLEEQLKRLHKDGDQEILKINDEIKTKKQQMAEHFTEELSKEMAQLEQDMLSRVDEYTKELHTNAPNIKELLEKQYRLKQEKIIKEICEDFWRE